MDIISYRNIAGVVGILWLSWLLLKTLKALAGDFCAFFLAPWGISRTNLKKYGSWAVVTGGSEGIGRGYALELARQGLNVVIISRSEEKLQKVADEIKQKYSREVRTISVDFAGGMEIYPNLAEQLQDLDIGILVNNVGLSGDIKLVHEQPAETHHKVIEVNCQSMVQMVKIVLPKMLEKKRGVIVNLSSGAGTLITPWLVVYCATKSFVNSFTEGLHKEYASKGIIIQCVAPFFVSTSKSQGSSFIAPDGVSYARAAVATIGIQKFTNGYFPHAILSFMTGFIPSRIFDDYASKALKEQEDRYLKEKAKAK